MANQDEFIITTLGTIDGKSAYLWDDTANWESGVLPVNGDSVTTPHTSVDNDSTLTSLSELAPEPILLDGVLVTAPELTVGTFVGGEGPDGGTELFADSQLTGTPVNVTVDNVMGGGATLGAEGTGASFIDNSATDSGNDYYAQNGGRVELASTVAATSSLNYDNGATFVLENGAGDGTPIYDLSPGDVLELPGTGVGSVIFEPNSLDITTTGTGGASYNFSLVSAGNVGDYTASFDSSTGLEAITFTSPETFAANTYGASFPTNGSYVWSSPTNWTSGETPVDGAYVTASFNSGLDDFANLSLTELTLVNDAIAQDGGGALNIGTAYGSTGTILSATGGYTLTKAPITLTVGNIIGSGATYEATGIHGAVEGPISFIDNSATDSGNTYIAAESGLMELAPTPAASSTLAYIDAGTIALEHPAASNAVALEGLSAGDVLELPGTGVSAVTFVGNSGLDITTTGTGGGSFDFTNVTYSGNVIGYTASFDSNTGLEAITFNDEPPCYCRGTRILTARGEVPVEQLRTGDLVVTFTGEGAPLKPITWIGHTDFDARRHPQPAKVWPVRILKDAFGEGMPHRDLLVSPGHSFLIDGVLIQALRLVNGATIIQDRTINRNRYYHVELPAHDIILSEGVPAESYLDTGNRKSFAHGTKLIELAPPKHWSETCRELVMSGAQLNSVRAQLLDRARALGFTTTADPEVRLVSAQGEIVRPASVAGNRYTFRLPREGRFHLASRTWIPAELMPESDDARRLGVCVYRIQIDEGPTFVALDSETLPDDGWHRLENGDESAWRWTDGFAALPWASKSISIELTRGAAYWQSGGTSEEALKLAKTG